MKDVYIQFSVRVGAYSFSYNWRLSNYKRFSFSPFSDDFGYPTMDLVIGKFNFCNHGQWLDTDIPF